MPDWLNAPGEAEGGHAAETLAEPISLFGTQTRDKLGSRGNRGGWCPTPGVIYDANPSDPHRSTPVSAEAADGRSARTALGTEGAWQHLSIALFPLLAALFHQP